MKEPHCTICGGKHYQSFCFMKPKKPIANKTPIKRTRLQKTPKPQTKRLVLKPQSSTERAGLIRRADRLFSIFIRTRHAKNGLARCVTCGIIDNYKNMDAGHFIARRFMAVRYDPTNVHVQCQRCNRHLGGNLKNYEAYMIGKYGREYIEELRTKARVGGKLTISQLLDICQEYS